MRDRVVAVASTPKTIALQRVSIDAVGFSELTSVPRCDYVLHFGYLTRNRVQDMGAAQFVAANLELTTGIVRLLDTWVPKGLFYSSSGAVYEPDGSYSHDLGANPYGVLKRLDELAFLELCRECQARCLVARVFSVAGPYITKPELYALGSFLRQARADARISIKSPRLVYRSYAAVTDIVASGIAHLVCDTADRELVLDTGGLCIELEQLAREVRSALGRTEIVIEREPLDVSLPPDIYCGAGADFEAALTRYEIPMTSLGLMIRQTAASLEH
jgi:nucleoside-diphosphate-sugar epimerase